MENLNCIFEGNLNDDNLLVKLNFEQIYNDIMGIDNKQKKIELEED